MSLRGHGNTTSSRDLTGVDFKLPQLGNDILLLLNYLKLDKVHFVGNSMGGNVGYELIKSCPNRLRSFTAFGTTGKLKKSGFTIGLIKFTYKLMSMKTIGKLSGSVGISEKSKSEAPRLQGGASFAVLVKMGSNSIFEIAGKNSEKTWLTPFPQGGNDAKSLQGRAAYQSVSERPNSQRVSDRRNSQR